MASTQTFPEELAQEPEEPEHSYHEIKNADIKLTPAKDYRKAPAFESAPLTFYPYQRLSTRGWKCYDILRTILCTVTLFPLRVIFTSILLLNIFIIAKLAMLGIDSSSEDYVYNSLSMWRAMLLMCLRPLARVFLFIIGVVWIKETKLTWEDLPAIPEQTPPVRNPYDKAQVIVANHLGYIDIVVLLAKYGCAFVAKEQLKNTWFVGTIAKALQVLFLQKDKPLTTSLVERIKKTYSCHQNRKEGASHMCGSCLSKLCIFPEGTTTNGDAMVVFRTGVFRSGMPVQPIAIRFPHSHFNLSWEAIYFREHLFRTMTQLINRVELLKLPIYSPSEAEMQDPLLFSRNVQTLLAAALNQSIYPLNRKHKFVYHEILLKKKSEAQGLSEAQELTTEDATLSYTPT